MSWLWENYREDGMYSVAWRPIEPSLEIGSVPRAVNPIPRFSEIFQPLADAGLRHPPELEDALLRFLARLDVNCGLDLRELALRRLNRELREGLWGVDIGEIYQSLTEEEKLATLNLLHEREKGANLALDQALGVFFPGSRAWKHEKTGDVLIALAAEESPTASRRLSFVLDLFLPIRWRVHLSWRDAPCLLDQPEAILDACFLY